MTLLSHFKVDPTASKGARNIAESKFTRVAHSLTRLAQCNGSLGFDPSRPSRNLDATPVNEIGRKVVDVRRVPMGWPTRTRSLPTGDWVVPWTARSGASSTPTGSLRS